MCNNNKIDSVFKLAINNQYTRRLIFGHVESIHQRLEIPSVKYEHIQNCLYSLIQYNQTDAFINQFPRYCEQYRTIYGWLNFDRFQPVLDIILSKNNTRALSFMLDHVKQYRESIVDTYVGQSIPPLSIADNPQIDSDARRWSRNNTLTIETINILLDSGIRVVRSSYLISIIQLLVSNCQLERLTKLTTEQLQAGHKFNRQCLDDLFDNHGHIDQWRVLAVIRVMHNGNILYRNDWKHIQSLAIANRLDSVLEYHQQMKSDISNLALQVNMPPITGSNTQDTDTFSLSTTSTLYNHYTSLLLKQPPPSNNDNNITQFASLHLQQQQPLSNDDDDDNNNNNNNNYVDHNNNMAKFMYEQYFGGLLVKDKNIIDKCQDYFSKYEPKQLFTVLNWSNIETSRLDACRLGLLPIVKLLSFRFFYQQLYTVAIQYNQIQIVQFFVENQQLQLNTGIFQSTFSNPLSEEMFNYLWPFFEDRTKNTQVISKCIKTVLSHPNYLAVIQHIDRLVNQYIVQLNGKRPIFWLDQILSFPKNLLILDFFFSKFYVPCDEPQSKSHDHTKNDSAMAIALKHGYIFNNISIVTHNNN
ncbi:hypothetical protein DFA_03022 [Cavenderia fasciculata]|uniref:Uncharacterized protein n=1 Tax=Cavenderia fasciculata TaxID=261658 RepID=F4PGE4_CACFS|nr:uncharacterized protein DFA_03022 [Cavenderia fasciculata]EGG24778.1 hypothetical protein DFA_03022 [Cavenderia fasciculata]|eukprot:XP_004362629.1 hypothetical protein DFA_03022 [Cavenderia fasciculata]